MAAQVQPVKLQERKAKQKPSCCITALLLQALLLLAHVSAAKNLPPRYPLLVTNTRRSLPCVPNRGSRPRDPSRNPERVQPPYFQASALVLDALKKRILKYAGLQQQMYQKRTNITRLNAFEAYASAEDIRSSLFVCPTSLYVFYIVRTYIY